VSRINSALWIRTSTRDRRKHQETFDFESGLLDTPGMVTADLLNQTAKLSAQMLDSLFTATGSDMLEDL
jgi:hypothetical protein